MRLYRNVKLKIHFAFLLLLLAPAISSAQQLGQVACARPGDYVYLYSSMTTFEVRSTLHCGQEVVITGRYDTYFAVRTANGETGYVPLASLLLIKTTPGEKLALPPTKAPNRERISYDDSFKPADPPSGAAGLANFLILRDSTPVTMKLENSHVLKRSSGGRRKLRSFRECDCRWMCRNPQGSHRARRRQ